jgi:hypothetical protein
MTNPRKTLLGARAKPPEIPKDPTKPKKSSPASSQQASSVISKTNEKNKSAGSSPPSSPYKGLPRERNKRPVESPQTANKTRKVTDETDLQSSTEITELTDEYEAAALPQSLSAVISSSMESIISAESNPKGVLSAASSQNNVAIIMPKSANINLDELASTNGYPETTRQVYITSISTPIVHLCKLNPIKVATEIDRLCGEVSKVDYKPSGSLLVTTHTLAQVRSILATTTFCNIPVQVTVAWTSQTSQGKIYAPEFLGDSIDDLLQLLRPSGVVGIRKLYQDPKKVNSPLYVIKFLTATRPAKLRVGYCQYNVDPYYSSPVRCNKCYIWGHPSKYCTSPPTCMRCGSRNHLSAACEVEHPKCSNCKGPHLSTYKQCPIYEAEKAICQYSAEHGVSFKEARTAMNNNQIAQAKNQQPPPNIQSSLAFPVLSQQHPIQPGQTIRTRISQAETHGSQTQASQNKTLPKSQESVWQIQSQRNRKLPYATQQEIQSQTRESDWLTQGQRIRKAPHAMQQELQEQQTQESAWLTQGQQSRSTQQNIPPNYDDHNLSLDIPQEPYQNSAFSNSTNAALLPSHLHEPDQNNNIAASLQTNASRDHTLTEVKQVLMLFIPPIMKLFFASTQTEKVDGFLEIGSILNSVGTVNDLLLKLGQSSLSSSQQH